MKSNYTIERTLKTGNGFKERLKVKAFKTSEAMHKFLNTESNALHWKQSNKGLSSGLFAFAGGQWHNVKTLDASILNHI